MGSSQTPDDMGSSRRYISALCTHYSIDAITSLCHLSAACESAYQEHCHKAAQQKVQGLSSSTLGAITLFLSIISWRRHGQA